MAHPSRSLPQLGDSEAYALLGEPVEAVTPLGHGTRSRVYRLDPAEGRPRVVRLTPRGSGRVARERAVRALTAGCSDIPTLPEVLAPPAAHGLDADVVVMDLLPGEPMSAALQHSSETDAAVLWHHFGRGLAAMHKIAVAGFGLLDGAGRGGFSSWRQFVEATAEAALDEARATPLVDLCDAAARAIAALASSLDGVRAEGRNQLPSTSVVRRCREVGEVSGEHRHRRGLLSAGRRSAGAQDAAEMLTGVAGWPSA